MENTHTADHVILSAAPASEAAAVAEVRRAAAGAEVVRRLEPGTLLVAVTDPMQTLLPAWQHAPPIWVRHVHPVHAVAPLLGGEPGLSRLEDVARPLAARLDADLPFSVQSRLVGAGPWPLARFDINQRLAALLQTLTGAPLDVRAPAQVLSLTATAERAYLGISPVGLNLSTWSGGQMRFAREEGEQISRSEFKLLEALDVFKLELPTRGAALDLGAAPGGWTRILRLRGLDVVALDPADLDGRLLNMPGVRHVRGLVQNFDPGTQRFVVITNDLRMDALASVQVMTRAAAWLQGGGLGFITLKLPEQHAEILVARALKGLEAAYRVLGARQLFHNRQEVTVALTGKR